MWETISTVLTSANAWQVLIFLEIAVFIFVLLVKGGVIAIKTKHFRVGQAEEEREIIRRQVEAAHDFIMSIEGKIPENPKYGGYFTKFILEIPLNDHILGEPSSDLCDVVQPWHALRSIDWNKPQSKKVMAKYSGIKEVVDDFLKAKGIKEDLYEWRDYDPQSVKYKLSGCSYIDDIVMGELS